MIKSSFSRLLLVLLLFTFALMVSAQTRNKFGDWNTLNSNLNNEVAVKAEKRKVVFGVLTSTDPDEIKVRISDKNNVSEVRFKRDEVEKIWLAKLNSSSRKTLLGAGIGAAAGAVIGLIALKSSEDSFGSYGAAVPVGAVVGAVVGGTVGFFVRDKNKKERLIFQS